MKRFHLAVVTSGWISLLLLSSASAQSMIVIGSDSLAHQCYLASTTAALTGSANQSDIDYCDKALQQALLKKRDLIATYVNRGVVHAAMENLTSAVKDYNKALKLDPNVAEAYINRGNLWFVASNYPQAIKDYNRSLELGIRQEHIVLLNRGMVYETTGRYKLAKQDYLAALEKVEEWPAALKKLERVNKKIK